MKGTVYKQFGKKGTRLEKPIPLPCELDVDDKGNALAINNTDRIFVEKMAHTRLETISAMGLRLSGFESIGWDAHGKEKFMYQEWYFVPTQEAINAEP